MSIQYELPARGSAQSLELDDLMKLAEAAASAADDVETVEHWLQLVRDFKILLYRNPPNPSKRLQILIKRDDADHIESVEILLR